MTAKRKACDKVGNFKIQILKQSEFIAHVVVGALAEFEGGGGLRSLTLIQTRMSVWDGRRINIFVSPYCIVSEQCSAKAEVINSEEPKGLCHVAF
jgi:hypothetical protein